MHPLELIHDHKHVIRRRDFRLNALPRDERGNLLHTGSSQIEFLAYVRWLSDYLYCVDIETSPHQQGLCDLVSGIAKEDAMFLLGGYAGLHEVILIDCDTMMAIDERFNYETITSFSDDDVEWICERAAYTRREYDRETNDPPPEATEPNISGIPVFVAIDLHDDIASREKVVQYLVERVDQHQYCPDGEGYACDIGWRLPIYRVLQNVRDPHEREDLLRKFFAAYVEFAMK